jgi:UDP-2-acetamido-2-deoxy-ribo-hexuluronate aminotransferase
MAVPFIDLKKQLLPIFDSIISDWRDCLDHTTFVGGSYVKNFEAAFQHKTGVNNFVSCANGTDALTLSLACIGIGPGHKVALPDVTFWATYEAIKHVGAHPVLLDIDPDDLQLSYERVIEAHELYKLDCILLPHLYGWCSKDLHALRKYCGEQNIALVEDAAQAFGVELDNEQIIKGAEIATMSFYPAKVIGGCMDGGGICTSKKAVADKLRSLGNHGRSAHYEYSDVGWNSRMGDIQASFLTQLLSQSANILESRRSALALYGELHAALGDDRIKMHLPPSGCTSNGYLLVLSVAGLDADAIASELRSAEIGVARTYPVPISEQPPVKLSLERGTATAMAAPHSKKFCQEVINLPLFAGITEEQIRLSWQKFAAIIAAH